MKRLLEMKQAVIRSLTLLGVVGLSVTMSMATVTNDRVYYMGEDDINSPGINDSVDTSGSGTYDSEYDGITGNQYFDAQDIRRITGAPTYQAGHGAGSTLSIRFGGADALAAVIVDGDTGEDVSWAFNRPDWYWDQDAFGNAPGYPRNYEGITNRGTQLWVKPTDVNGTRQDILLDSSEFGGVVITENNKWGMAWDMDDVIFTLENDGIFESDADVQQDEWTHVMQVSLTSTTRGVLYINGIAVVSSLAVDSDGNLRNYGYDPQPWNEDRTERIDPEPLFIGGSDLDGDGTYENFFKGEVDDVNMFLWGDNSGQAGPPEGQDWGTFNLLTDNEYVAQQMDGIDAGDVNLDGMVDDTDINIFIANWKKDTTKELIGMTAVDFDSYKMGDLNLDGVVSLLDWDILADGYVLDNPSAPEPNLGQLLNDVPEPTTMALLGLGGLAMLRRRRSAKNGGEKKMHVNVSVGASRNLLGLTILMVGLMTATTYAQVITPVGVTTDDEFFPVSQLIDDSGMTSGTNPLRHSQNIAVGSTSWVTSAPNGGTGDFFDNSQPGPVLVFDLGSDMTLSNIGIWAYPGGAGTANTFQGNSANDFELRFSTDALGSTFTGPAVVTGIVDHPPILVNTNDAGEDLIKASFIDFTGVTARYVEMTITDNYSGEANAVGGDRVGLGEVKFNIPEPSGGIDLVINRDTGQMTLTNNFDGNLELRAYSIDSANGALDQTQWNSIAEVYDANDGNGTLSGDWLKFSAVDSNEDLAEGIAGQSTWTDGVSFDLGNTWIKTFEENITLEVLLDSDDVVDIAVTYVGNGDVAFAKGDLNFDNAIDSQDWVAFKTGFDSDATGLSAAQSYLLGDMNGDGEMDRFDFDEFKAIYDATNGAGAFDVMIASVPEPATMALLSLGSLAMIRRRRSVKNHGEKKMQLSSSIRLPGLAMALAVLLVSSVVSASVVKPVSATSTITGDAGSNVNYLLDDNPGFAADALTLNGVATTLESGTSFADGFATEHAYGGGAHAESWTKSTNDGNPVFTFDLSGGGNTTIGSLLLWQYGNSGGTDPNRNGNHTREFEVIFHTEAQGDSFDFDTETVDFSGVMERTLGVPTTSPAQPFGLDAQVDVRYAAFKIVSNYINQPGLIAGGDRYGLGEVRFADDIYIAPELVLSINESTGKATLKSNDSEFSNFDVDYYEINSASDALTPDSWTSLEDSDFEGNGPGDDSGNGWEELASKTSKLTEAYLQDSSLMDTSTDIDLGNVWDTNGAQDLEMIFRTADGTYHTATVEYFTPAFVLGDVNGDGLVNGFDVDPFVDVLLNGPYQIEADVNEDGAVNGFDVDPFVALVLGGGSAPDGIEVPEPTTLVLLSLGGLAALRRKHA